jgi:EpsI family protein
MNADTTMANRYLAIPELWHTLPTKHRTRIHFCLLAGVVLFVHYRTFVWLLQIWWELSKYSHGFLIPLIASYLIWIKRDQLARLPRRPHLATGALFLLVSAILLLAGRAGGFILLEAISFLILLPGIVLSVWGPGHLRALILPLAYLQFMVPWMEELIARASWSFQLFSAYLASLLLQAIGFSVFRESTHLQLSHITLEVTPGCSGISFLTATVALGIPLVYLTQRTWLRAAGVLSFGVAVTILANGVRVAFLGAMSYFYGESMLHDTPHILQGWFVSQVGILFLFIVNWAVMKLPCDRPVPLHGQWTGTFSDIEPTGNASRSAGRSALLIVLLLAFGFYLHFFASTNPVPPKLRLAEFPHVIDRWHARDSAWIDGRRFFPGVAAETIRAYQTAEKEIFLYIGYFASQRQGESLIGAASNPIRDGARELSVPQSIAGLQRANHSALMIDTKRYETLFWYHLPSGNVTGRYETKMKQVLDAVIHGHNNGAVVLLAAPTPENYNGAATVHDLWEFASVLAPVLEEFLP